MGSTTNKTSYLDQDFIRFRNRLEEQLQQLRKLLDDNQLNTKKYSIGAELELYLIHPDGEPAFLNQEICDRCQDPQLQLELNRFNLEYNFLPHSLHGKVFQRMRLEADQAIGKIRQQAQHLHADITQIGILPTLRPSHFHQCMTDLPRYHALEQALRNMREGPFEVSIEGQDQLHLHHDQVTLEGANTSWQVHLRIPADEFADWYNAIQLVTPVALALSANSPVLFGKHLWQETRVALFRQSIDHRVLVPAHWHQPARVSYGEGWVRESAWELFAGCVALYPPLLPECVTGKSRTATPDLAELRMHMGTIWLWNRPVYDPADQGHLRIEMRSLPSGPTHIDMLASTAFLIGCAAALRTEIRERISALPFRYCLQNFLQAARNGLQAKLIWPERGQMQLYDRPVLDIARQLLPVARQGLASMGVNQEDIQTLMDTMEGRLEYRQTGANWLARGFYRLGRNQQAIASLLQQYCQHSQSGQPVYRWEAAT